MTFSPWNLCPYFPVRAKVSSVHGAPKRLNGMVSWWVHLCRRSPVTCFRHALLLRCLPAAWPSVMIRSNLDSRQIPLNGQGVKYIFYIILYYIWSYPIFIREAKQYTPASWMCRWCTNNRCHVTFNCGPKGRTNCHLPHPSNDYMDRSTS